MRLLRHRYLMFAQCVFILFSALAALPQIPAARQRITQAINEQTRITRPGNVHPLARAEFDRGAAPDGLPANRMLLLLQRGPEQQTALDKFVEEQHVPSSPNYHKWLTPAEFGQTFGPSDADIATVTNWLISHGFQVNNVSAGRTTIEFSGTVGQVRDAFHTEIHKFVVDGEQHWANATNPQIPVALAPVVSGVVTLHNFRRKPMSHRVAMDLNSGLQAQPAYSSSGGYYGLGPTDFATIYSALPLWNSGIDGAGQSIAVIGETNINIQDVRDFRNLFGLPANDPDIVLNGVDPGITSTEEEMESDLDVQWSGAVAPLAKIKFVVTASTDLAQGIDLSSFYAIDNDLAPVITLSYGLCEAALGTGGNQFYNMLWEQAAAQGITVFVSSGDSGSAGCDIPDPSLTNISRASNGLAVSGLASTPFNVAVGGTDFDQVGNYSTFWKSTNDPTTLASAKSYIPEMTWNESCAQQGQTCLGSPHSIWAGSGGPSSIYNKPSWQYGGDSKRDLPDVSLFASGGFNRSFYMVCQGDNDGACALGSYLAVGGTSAAAPAFAGIMALVNHYAANHGLTARQGNANYTFYNLAAKPGASCNSTTAGTSSTCSFYDTTKGNISVPCAAGTANCTSGVLVDPNNAAGLAWTATTGYDMATGLGSVNVANLATNWASVTFKPTTTTITTPGPITGIHGQPVTLNVAVAPTSDPGTPSGDVALIVNLSGGSRGLDTYTLNAGVATAQTTSLPGGTYNASFHYAGDGSFAASDSNPIQVSITPESSKTTVALVTYDLSGNLTSRVATTAAYGSPYVLRANVTNSSGQVCYNSNVSTCARGEVTLTDNGTLLDGGSFELNSLGSTDDLAIQLAAGTHPIAASYGGDSSYTGSSVTASFVITKALTSINTPSPDNGTVAPGATVNISATVTTLSNGPAPSGAVTFYDGGTPLSGTVNYSQTDGGAVAASLKATIATSFSTSGTKTITAKYIGDSNYAASATSAPTTIQVTAGGGTPPVADFSFPATSPGITIAAKGQSGTSIITLTSVGSYTGAVTLTCAVNSTVSEAPGCGLSPSSVTPAANGTATSTLTITTTGPHTVSASIKGWLAGSIFACFLLGIPGRKRKLTSMIVLLVACLVIVGGMSACGGGGSTPSAPTTRTDPGTPAGSYTVTITGTPQAGGTATTHTTTVTVTVP